MLKSPCSIASERYPSPRGSPTDSFEDPSQAKRPGLRVARYPARDALSGLCDVIPLFAGRHLRSRLHVLRDAVDFFVGHLVAANEAETLSRIRVPCNRSCESLQCHDRSFDRLAPPTSGEASLSHQSLSAPCRALIFLTATRVAVRRTLAHSRSLASGWPHEAAKTSWKLAP